jgi:hypothetical protein
MDATGENRSLWCAPGLSALNNTVVLARFAALAHIFSWRKIAFHLMRPRDWGSRGVRGDDLVWIRRNVSAV